jgi:prophage regulatory protein
MATQSNQLPEVGFLKIQQIIGNKKTNTPAILPVGRTTFLNGVKSGKYPKPVKLGARSVAWRVADIKDLLERLGAENHQA